MDDQTRMDRFDSELGQVDGRVDLLLEVLRSVISRLSPEQHEKISEKALLAAQRLKKKYQYPDGVLYQSGYVKGINDCLKSLFNG